MRALIIHNPLSGFGSDAIYEFQRSLLQQGDEAVVRVLKDNFNPEAACHNVADFDLVVLSGGDGTMATFLYYLKQFAIPTCIFPSGTSNLLFLNLGNAADPAAIANACRNGLVIKSDLGEICWKDAHGSVHTKGFCLMSGLGYDGEFMQLAAQNKAALGEAAYFAAAISTLTPKVSHFTITVDGKTYKRTGISCIVANNAMIQGDIKLIPNNTMTDGLLDIMVLRVNRTYELLPSVITSLFDKTGKNLGRPMIETFRGKDIEVTSTKMLPLQTDGDPSACEARWYHARVLPKVNDLIVDATSFYASQAQKAATNLPGAVILPYPAE